MIAPALSRVFGPDDSVEYGLLPDTLKREVGLWETVIARVYAAPHPAREIKVVAREMSGVRGFSEESIERKYYAVKNGGSWRVYLNRNKLGNRRASSGMTALVVQVWHETLTRHQRKCKPAYREIVRQYRAGEKIGDVDWTVVWKQRHPHAAIPTACPPDMPLPDGWSYDNFMRKQPKRADLVAARIGEKAAQQYRYQVHTTRNGIHVGEAYVFDDMWHDLVLNFVGQTASVRPLELGGADVFSGYKFDPGFRPRRTRLDGKRDGLGEGDMRLYLAHVLCNIGYYRGGCTLYVEHGTAAIAKHLDAVLEKFSGGLIKVQRSGIEGVKQYAQLYAGKGAGNPRLKAGYEALHNLVHNEVDALPAQTGMDRAHTPESLYGRDALNSKLLIACYALTPARASLLRFPVMEWGVGIEAIMHAYYNMNRRTDHELEGWITAKLVKHQFRLGPAFPWQDHRELDRLNDDQRRAVEAIISLPDYHQVIRMSPYDVWSAGQADLVKLPLHVLPLICGEDLATVRTCPPSDQIDFMDISISPDPMYFETRVTTAEGYDKRLQEGREYRWLINPFDPRQCFVSETNGSYLGTARRCNVPCKTDADALHREMGIAARHEKEATLRLTQMNRPEIQRRIADAQHNAAVMNGDPMLAEEIADINARKARHAADDGDYQDMASAPARAPATADSAYGVSMAELNDL